MARISTYQQFQERNRVQEISPTLYGKVRYTGRKTISRALIESFQRWRKKSKKEIAEKINT